MPCLHRAVLLRAAAAALVLATALGVEAAAGHALARRGAERAERDARACTAAVRAAAELRADRSAAAGRPLPGEAAPAVRCPRPERPGRPAGTDNTP
ncbi:hypothetical protein [Kitasatospora paranensis]|uniref:hypothetical protein n=1 Tax=Kitasatospora paranensis TaxID=258053 RepID=UPI0031EE88AE